LNPLQKLPQPIFSRRLRRIIFIPTTWQKLIGAAEINDLYDESPLEDRLWAEFKRFSIQVERQELVTIEKDNYFLDFAVYCAKGKLDIETDGDSWHAERENIAQDNFRDNALEAVGWHVLRFNTHQIREEADSYCIEKVVKTINNLGGVDEGKLVPRRIDAKPDSSYQMGLFDDF
jgi:very-short-patch-repair endonuclease